MSNYKQKRISNDELNKVYINILRRHICFTFFTPKQWGSQFLPRCDVSFINLPSFGVAKITSKVVPTEISIYGIDCTHHLAFPNLSRYIG